MMSISICYKFVEGPWGGVNQFLKALKKEFKKLGVYEENPEKADIILFNSYPFGAEYLFWKLLKLKQKHPEKIIIYRLDGPISSYRGEDKEIDKIIQIFNKLFVDGIIFQSNWCREMNRKHFGITSEFETIIHNAPDKDIFNRRNKTNSVGKKTELIAVSWSPNLRKGFEIYRYLDEHLDFSKYEMTFVGNSPIGYKNIKWIKPVSSKELAQILKEHDIYVTASRSDPCSNSLIEAISCGLPAVALNDGGHPELIQGGGELFNGREDVLEKIEKVSENYYRYQSQLPEFSITEIAQKYCEFAQSIYDATKNRDYRTKIIDFSTTMKFIGMMLTVLKWKTSKALKENIC